MRVFEPQEHPSYDTDAVRTTIPRQERLAGRGLSGACRITHSQESLDPETRQEHKYSPAGASAEEKRSQEEVDVRN